MTQARGQVAQARALLRESLSYARERDVYLAVEVVESLAGVVAAGGAGDIAARLWGAASAVRGVEGWPLPPVVRADYDRDVAAARTQFGETAFAAAWAEGRAMTLEQAIAYALEDDTTAA